MTIAENTNSNTRLTPLTSCYNKRWRLNKNNSSINNNINININNYLNCNSTITNNNKVNNKSDSHSSVGIIINVVMVESHEYDVDNDAERDGQLREGIEDEEGQDLTGLQPDVAAIPDAEDVDGFFEVIAEDLLVLRALVVVVVHEAADVSGLAHWTLWHLINDIVQDLNILKWNLYTRFEKMSQKIFYRKFDWIAL